MVPGSQEAAASPAPLPTAGDVRRFLDATAALLRFPPWTLGISEVYAGGEWLEALVLVESSGRPDVRRYEPHLDRVADGDVPVRDDGDREDDSSWGPMQVLGSNLRELLGLAPMTRANWRRIACNWPVGVGLGALFLERELRGASGRVAVALARYNGGPRDNPRPDGTLRNQDYVDRVRAKAAEVWADRVNQARSSEVRRSLGAGR